MLTENLQRIFVWPREVWGKWPPKKTGITRPRPHGGVKKWVLLDPVLTAG